MGYAVVFWIDERLVRGLLGDKFYIPGSCGHDVVAKVGTALHALLIQYGHGDHGPRHAELDGTECFHGVTMFHSTGEALLEWNEGKLVVVDYGHDDEQVAARLADLRERSSSGVRLPLRGRARTTLIQRIGAGLESPESAQQHDGLASVFWVYEDWYRDHKHGEDVERDRLLPRSSYGRKMALEERPFEEPNPGEFWPLEEMGRAVLEMIMLRTEYSAAIGRHGNAINKAASLVSADPAGFIWSGNCLREVHDPSLPR